jgi:hypothetical protein
MEDIREDYQLKIKNGEIISTDKVPFWCDVDKEYYWQTLSNHNQGDICPKCSKSLSNKNQRRKDYPFIDEIREDYQLLIKNGEIKRSTKVPFICEKHGVYWQRLSSHCDGQNCPKCFSENNRRTEYSFIDEIREDYQLKIRNGEINNSTKIPFICKKHGEYWQTLNKHYMGRDCPKCVHHISKIEIQIFNFIKEYYPNTINNIRNLLPDKKLELDIYIPELKIGIEYNGLIWHSEKYHLDKYNLLNKTIEFNNQSINVIHIFEDEWLDNKELCKKKLLFILNNNNNYNINEYYQLFGNNNVLDLRYFNKDNNPFINNGYIENNIISPSYFYINNQKRILKNEIIDNNKYYKIYDCGYIEYYK